MRLIFILGFGLSLLFTGCTSEEEKQQKENLQAEAQRLEMEMEDALHYTSEDSIIEIQDSLRDFPVNKGIELQINIQNFEDTLQAMYQKINLEPLKLPYEVFRHGMIGFYQLRLDGKLKERNLFTIIDFTQSSCDKRFYTLDLDSLDVMFNTYVAHGRNSGGNFATTFSNDMGSNQSSLGFYVTAETYTGSKGYSMRLDGVEEGINDRMRDRAVVMHNAKYVSEDWIKKYGRLGRSQGCPALPEGISREVIDSIQGGTAIFAYFQDTTYLNASSYLNLDKLMEGQKIKPPAALTSPILNPVN